MTREEAAKGAAVMLAWAEGKTIQCRGLNERDDTAAWSDSGIGSRYMFDFTTEEYRVRPESREWWIVEWGRADEPHGFSLFLTREEATNCAREAGSARIIRVQQVEES